MNIMIDNLESTSDCKVVVGFVGGGGVFGDIRFSVTHNNIKCLETTIINENRFEEYLQLYNATLNYAKGIQITLNNNFLNDEPEPVSVSIMHVRNGQSFEELASFVDKARIVSLGKRDSEIVMVMNNKYSDHEVVCFDIKNPEDIKNEEEEAYNTYLTLKKRFENH